MAKRYYEQLRTGFAHNRSSYGANSASYEQIQHSYAQLFPSYDHFVTFGLIHQLNQLDHS